MNNPNSGNNFDIPHNAPNSDNRYGYMQPEYGMYSGSYGGRPPKKKNNNTIIIILVAIVSLLLCSIIALTAILIAKSFKKAQQPASGLAQIVDIPKITSTIGDVAFRSNLNNPTYVTCVSDAQVYVRSGPGKENNIVYKINGGDTSVKLKSTGNSTYGKDGYVWYEVTLPNGNTAWVRSDVVTMDGPNPYQRKSVPNSSSSTNIGSGSVLVTKSYNSRIFVRSGPSKSYSVVYIIAAGDTSKRLITTGIAQRDSSGYTWYQVLTPANQVAWVRNDIVTTAKGSNITLGTTYAGTSLVTKSYKSRIFVRSGPSKSYKVVYIIAAGDTSKKLITTGLISYDSSGYLWYQVRTPDGQTAWVRNDIVTVGTSGGSGNNAKTISVSSGSTLVTKSYNSRIFVRSGPGKSYKVVYTIEAGDTSKKLTTTGNAQYDSSGYLWYQVRTPNGQTAWVRQDIVTTSSSGGNGGGGGSYSSGTLVTKSYNSVIYVRSGPDKSYKIVYTIGAGDTSKKLSYTGSSQKGGDGYIWYNVITPNGVNAWVRSDIVQFQ